MTLKLISINFLLIFLFVQSSFATSESMSQYWKETGITYEAVTDHLTNEICNSAATEFLACVNALNTTLRFKKDEPFLTILAAETVTPNSEYGDVEKDLGVLKIVQLRKKVANEIISLEAVKKRRAEREAALLRAFTISAADPFNFEDVFKWLEEKIVSASDNESLVTGATLNAYLEISKDPHTAFIPKKYFSDMQSSTSEELIGVGIRVLSIEKTVVVQSLLPKSPALEAGIRPKDSISEVDGVKVSSLTLEEVIERIRGKENTSVKLKIKRKDGEFEKIIFRKKFVMTNVSSEYLEDPVNPVGYIKLDQFIATSCRDIKAAVEDLTSKKVTSFILDMRSNPGGLLNSATCISSLFVGRDKPIVIQKYLNGLEPDEILKGDQKQVTDLPLVTLLNAQSASASELTAGALQILERALVVGERSFGKGSVQILTSSPIRSKGGENLSFARTIARFYQTEKLTNQIRGIHPNLEVFTVPNPTEEQKLEPREEDLYSTALPAVGEEYKETRPALVAKIQDCVAKTGKAKGIFEAHADDAIPADYQLLYARDVLTCQMAH